MNYIPKVVISKSGISISNSSLFHPFLLHTLQPIKEDLAAYPRCLIEDLFGLCNCTQLSTCDQISIGLEK